MLCFTHKKELFAEENILEKYNLILTSQEAYFSPWNIHHLLDDNINC